MQFQKTEIPSVTYERPLFNTRTRYTIIPRFPKGDPRADVPRSPDGSPGVYHVTFVLSVPGRNVFYDDLNFDEIMKSGDSLLFVGRGVEVHGAPLGSQGRREIVFSSNAQGRLAIATMRIEASNFADAEKAAFDTISAELSYWSFLYDVAIDIGGWRVIEERTQSAKFAFGSVGKIKLFDKPDAVNNVKAYAPLYAAYREGMNATNPFYQALSFYKVTEGVTAERKRRERAVKSTANTRLNVRDEKFPRSVEELNNVDEIEFQYFQDYLGTSFEDARSSMTTVIRNAIAHLAKFDEVLSPDTFEDQEKCNAAIPVLRYIAREMIKNDLASFSHAPATATTKSFAPAPALSAPSVERAAM